MREGEKRKLKKDKEDGGGEEEKKTIVDKQTRQYEKHGCSEQALSLLPVSSSAALSVWGAFWKPTIPFSLASY